MVDWKAIQLFRLKYLGLQGHFNIATSWWNILTENISFSGKEAQPRPLGEDHGVLVYNYKPSNQVNYFRYNWPTTQSWNEPFMFSRSVPGGSPSSSFSEPVRSHITSETLLFESRFESGNLEKAVKITESYYELYLRPDFYTSRHCQWFYFQVWLIC